MDRAELGDAFDAHAQAVYAFCARRCGDRVEAEDLLSVVFLEAWRSRDRAVQVDESWRPWLLGIATNVLRNAARAKRRHQAAMARFHADTTVDDPANVAVRSADLPALRDGLAQALASLSRREREVADLCLVEGLSSQVAAVALGIPEGTVKSRLARAREHLRSLLRSSDITDPTAASGHQSGESQIGSARPRQALIRP